MRTEHATLVAWPRKKMANPLRGKGFIQKPGGFGACRAKMRIETSLLLSLTNFSALYA
jgi:hypothetical protein